MKRKLFILSAYSFLIIFILSSSYNCSTNKPPVKASDSYASLDSSVKYVGINTCKQCHADIYETFIHTGMGSSFDFASHRKSSAKFDGHSLVYDTVLNFYYKPYWEGDSLRILEFRLEGKDTVHKRLETINYIVGSGQHTNSHIMNTNGYFTQAPATFYTQKGIWDLPPGFDKGNNSRFTRLIGLECMTCHNGYPDFVMGSENKYNAVKNGIDCERCHGPGEQHVKEKQEGKIIDINNAIDYSIVNPAKLSANLQFDICQRCHIQGNAVLNEGKSFYDFRPGMHLSDVMNVFMPLFKGRENEHIMASHAERLKLSKCYLVTMQKAEAKIVQEPRPLKPYKDALTCVTCHNPHVSVRVTGKEVFNNACIKCHSTGHEMSCKENPVKLKEADNNCISCHMPKSGALDIPHVRVTDHYIHIPVPEELIDKVRKFVGIACINNPTPSDYSKGSAYIAYFEKFNFAHYALDSAKKYFDNSSPENVRKNFHSLIHMAYLENDYNKIIDYVNRHGNVLKSLNTKSYDNKDAWTAYRIAEAYQKTGQSEISLEFFRKSTLLAPYYLEFENKYASALSLAGKNEDAKIILQSVVKENPKNVAALSNLGYIILITENNPDKAEQLYDRALSLNPDYEQALLNKSGILIYRRDFIQAKKLLNKILLINPSNQQAKNILEQIKTES